MMEFLIRRTDGDWFDLHRDRFAEVFRAEGRATRVIEGPGDHCVVMGDTRPSITYDDPGLHLVFEGPMSPAEAAAIAEELRARVCAATGQAGVLVPL